MIRDKAIIARLQQRFGAGSFSTKTGEYIVKVGFFYRGGRTAETIAKEVKETISHIEITAAEEHYNTWPRNSFWLIRFRLTEVL
jgi:hypothetical protein